MFCRFVSFTILLCLCLSCEVPKLEPQSSKARVIAMTPSLTEALFAASSEVELVATSQFTKWPEAALSAKKLPSAGILESILALKPDLVLLHSSDQLLAEKLRRLDVKTLSHSMDAIDGIMEAIAEIGRVLGQDAQATASIAMLKSDIAEVKERYAHRKQGDKAQTLVIVDRADSRGSHFYIAQNAAYLAELLSQCGADVIAVNAENWTQIDAERLMRLAPPNIVYFAHGQEDAQASTAIFNDFYSKLPAVQNHRLIVLSDDSLAVPGTRVAQSMETICKSIEVFFDVLP